MSPKAAYHGRHAKKESGTRLGPARSCSLSDGPTFSLQATLECIPRAVNMKKDRANKPTVAGICMKKAAPD
jgi:hypothetical protein